MQGWSLPGTKPVVDCEELAKFLWREDRCWEGWRGWQNWNKAEEISITYLDLKRVVQDQQRIRLSGGSKSGSCHHLETLCLMSTKRNPWFGFRRRLKYLKLLANGPRSYKMISCCGRSLKAVMAESQNHEMFNNKKVKKKKKRFRAWAPYYVMPHCYNPDAMINVNTFEIISLECCFYFCDPS